MNASSGGSDPVVEICLREEQFLPDNHVWVSGSPGAVRTHRFDSGVAALDIKWGRWDLVVLPFRGQQVWRLFLDGEDLTMQTSFDEPASSLVFGESYGAFLVHCGLSGIGAPGVDDQHAHHGELPTIASSDVRLQVQPSADGAQRTRLEVVSVFSYKLSHAFDYQVRITLRIDPAASTLKSRVEVTNNRAEPLKYGYLCHLNFKLDQELRLLQSAPDGKDGISFYPHPAQDRETSVLLADYELAPELSNQLSPKQRITPEYCAVLTPVETEAGVAEFLARRADNSAYWVGFETEILKRAVRWISNTSDEHAAGFCLPATGHHLGRTRNEEDQLLRVLGPGETDLVEVEFGLLDAQEATRVEERIHAVAMSQGATLAVNRQKGNGDV